MEHTENENKAAGAPSALNVELGTELALSNENGEYTVRVRAVEMNIGDMFEHLIVPVLLAAGYSTTVVNEYLHG